MRPIIVVLLAALAAGSVSAPVGATSRAPMNPAPPRSGQSGFADALRQADAAVKAKDWDGAYRILKPVLDSEALAAQPSAVRHAVLTMFSLAAIMTDHGGEALAAAKLACALPEAEAYDWRLRAFAAWQAKDGLELANTFATLGQRWPDEVRSLGLRQVFGMHMQVSQTVPATDALAKFDAALFDAGWRPETVADKADTLWIEYAGILLDRGDVAGARRVVAQITMVDQIVQMRADKRFDPVVQRDSPALDPRRAAQVEVERLTQASKAAPGSLDLLLALVTAKRRLGQNAEALAQIEGAVARIKAEGPGAFTDTEEQSNWLYDLQARLLMDSGRVDEALAIQEKGAALKEEGGDNTSQVLNLGSQYVALGRPRDALAAIAKVGGMSPYGEMVRLYVDGCARAQLGDAAAVQADLAKMRKLWPINGDALQDVLICANDLDGAAKVLIQRLEDPQQRADVLRDAQEYNDRAYEPPFEKVTRERERQIFGRPDVQAVLARYGRTERYDLWPVDS